MDENTKDNENQNFKSKKIKLIKDKDTKILDYGIETNIMSPSEYYEDLSTKNVVLVSEIFDKESNDKLENIIVPISENINKVYFELESNYTNVEEEPVEKPNLNLYLLIGGRDEIEEPLPEIPHTILTFRTTTDNESIKLPLESNGNYDFNVDWGDGTNNDITSYDQTEVEHTYITAGDYDINITGTLEGFNFHNGHSDSNNKIIDIKRWGDLKLRTTNYGSDGWYFYYCNQLETFSATDAPDLSEVSSFESLFLSCSKFNGNINHWNVSTITNMYKAFQSCKYFNQPLDNWDVSNVIDMGQMFYQATKFNQSLNNWDVSSVTNMAYTFYSAFKFNQPLNNWNVGNVVNMNQMFYQALVFNQPLDNWNVSNVTDMSRMFMNANVFDQDIHNWNVDNVTSYYQFKANCLLTDEHTPSKFL